jgi:hypothetical protein
MTPLRLLESQLSATHAQEGMRPQRRQSSGTRESPVESRDIGELKHAREQADGGPTCKAQCCRATVTALQGLEHRKGVKSVGRTGIEGSWRDSRPAGIALYASAAVED